MEILYANDFSVTYQDEKGNSIKVLLQDKSVMSAFFNGVEYEVYGSGVTNNYWKKNGKGRISKEFREWFKQVEAQMGDKIYTKNLSEW